MPVYDVPPSYHSVEQQLQHQPSCVMQAAQFYRIHPYVIQAIIDVEGGMPGTISKNTNNSYDLGTMQINTTNLPTISKSFPQLTMNDIVYNTCANISVGTWLLRRHLDAEPDYWRAIGNYHSKTPSKHAVYLAKVVSAYRGILERTKRFGRTAPELAAVSAETSQNQPLSR